MSSGSVKDFYNGKTLLVTGAMGFIGRLLLAKLMRMGNVKEILLLARAKKGKTHAERLDKVLSGFLFEDMSKYDANFRSKLKLITGDMEVDGLGISGEDREYIEGHVEVVIHAAATVRFDEPLKSAIAINIRGTKSMIDLAMGIRKLKSFVYISTAYSQCPQSEIKEQFYKPPMGYREAIDICEKIEEDLLNAMTANLIKPWPNTYTFTKAISEDLIREYEDKLPIAIIRPSIVQGTIREPVAGYVDQIIGPFGFAIGCAVGVIRIAKIDPNFHFDVIPSDIVVNSTLVVAKKASEIGGKVDEGRIYNCTICNVRRVPFHLLTKHLLEQMDNFPTKSMVWMPRTNVTSSQFAYRVCFVLYHYLPAFFCDIILRLKGSKIRLVSIYSKIFYHFTTVEYFISHNWTFEDNKMQDLYRTMSEKDHEDFYVRLSPDVYESQVISTVKGLRNYFFKENDGEDLKLARRKLKMFKVLHHLLLAGIYWLIYKCVRMFV